MSHSVLASFDPHATHPFTNNSGLMPKPAAPSKYPHLIPSPAKAVHSHSVPPPNASIPVHTPQPKRSPARSAQPPIFVPFRPERSSPELDDILLKKKFTDVFVGKQPWSIDQLPVAGQSSTRSKAR